jgi:hypothetical protein
MSARSKATARYDELPLPSTTEEAWRFTDLRGFDPDAYALDASPAAGDAEHWVELDVAATAVVTESGISIEQAPDRIRFEPLT